MNRRRGEMAQSDRLRELATWYREFADKAGAPAI